MAFLKIIHGQNIGRQYALDQDRAVLGRHPECDVVLDYGAVSREHAQLLRLNRDWYAEDLKSRNGTFVNGQAITGRQRLRENDQLKICDFVFTFHLEPTTRTAPRPPGTASADSAILVDDDTTSVMSSLDASRATMQFSVNPEMKLKALMEITRNLGSTVELEEVLPKVLDSLFKIFIQADRGFVVLWDAERNALIPKAVKQRRGTDDSVRISRTIVNKVMTSKEAILSADAASDSRFDTSQSIADFRIRSMMCAPLLSSEGQALGVIQIDTLDQRSRFQHDDIEVLLSVAYQAAIAIENAQLHEAALNQRSLQRDLLLAHQVQQGILPSAPPVVSGYEFFDYYESANQVGGDYYDYVALPGERLGVLLADVSGKGISAALLMAKLSSEARFSLFTEPTPAAALNRLNDHFKRGGWEDRFVTMVLAILDLTKGEVTIANAGHMAPLLRRANGTVDEIGEESAGVPLGVDVDARYEQTTYMLQPGELLTIYTDGINEAMNEANELYTIERIRRILAAEATCASDIGGRILGDVKKFVGKRTQSDDMCLICFGRGK